MTLLSLRPFQSNAMSTKPQTAKRTILLLALLGACLYGTAALYLVFNGSANVDEGFYGLAAREAATHGALPYRDFGYTQAPLFPFIQGSVMRFTGFGLIGGRLASGLWALLAVGTGTVMLWRRKPALGVCFALLMTTSLNWMYLAHLDKTHALTGLLVLLGAVTALSGWGFPRRMILLSLLGTLAVGCRLPAGPFFAVVWAGMLLREMSLGNILRALTWPALFCGALIVPFIAVAPRQAWFWALEFHRVSNTPKFWSLDIGDLFVFAPALVLLTCALAAGILVKRVRLPRPLDIVLLGLLAGLACTLLPRGAYPEYGMAVVPGLMLALCLAMGTLPGRALAVGCALCCLANLAGRPQLDPFLYANTRRAAALVRGYQDPQAPFVGSASLVALEAGSPVDGRMIMGPFSCTEAYTPAQADSLRLITPEGISRLMEDPRCHVFVLLHSLNLNFVWSIPRFDPVSQGAIGRWKDILRKDFVLDHADGDYVVFVRKSLYPNP